MKRFVKILILFCVFLFSALGPASYAQTISIDASGLVPRAELFLSPRSGSFVEGATFDVPILLDSKGNNINGIEVRVSFDKNKLTIIKPSSGKSIIGVWIEPPKYDNTNGTASYVGVVPDGITTNAGLIGTITFKAIQTGSASVSISSNSNILLNDGLGTKLSLDLGRAKYDILHKAPEGVMIYSETHPFQDKWYNNNSPVISWEKDGKVDGFSFEFDDKPSTIPDNTIDTVETSTSFQNISDGMWYFHIKASKNGVWGATGHFLVRIDTESPAVFKPEANYLLAATALIERALVSFFTTDNLSGVDHYEVGVVDKKEQVNISPAFVQAESPFQVPLSDSANLTVVVRAIDKAGNVRDGFVDISRPFFLTKFIKDYLNYVLLAIIFIGLLSFLIHYLFGHHIVRNIRRFRQFVKKEDETQGGNDQQNKPNLPSFRGY
jgi:hypothetical protein